MVAQARLVFRVSRAGDELAARLRAEREAAVHRDHLTRPRARARAQLRGARHRVLDDERAGAVEGEPTRPPPTLEDAATALVRTGSHALEHRAWTDAHREEARRLQAEGLSWAQVAEQVCGDRRFKSTVAGVASSCREWRQARGPLVA